MSAPDCRAPGPAGVAIRRLTYGDLPAVLAIERRSFPAPWSLAMFVLELSKPSGICLAAESRDGPRRLPRLLALRRHLAPDERRRRRRPARRRGLASRLIARAARDRPAASERFTLEVRISNAGAIRMYERLGFRPAGRRLRYYHDNNEDALIMWFGEPDAEQHRSLILAIETSCDDTCAAVDRRRARAQQRDLLAGGRPRALRRRRPRGRLAPPRRARQPGRRCGAGRGRRRRSMSRRDRRHRRGPG